MSVEGKIRKKYRMAKIPEKSDVLPEDAFTTERTGLGRIKMFIEFAATGLAVVAAIMLIIVGQSVLKLRNSVEKTGGENLEGVTTLEADGVPGNSDGNEETTAEPQTTDPDSEPEILYNGSPLQLYSVLIWSESDGLSVDGLGSEYTVEELIQRENGNMPINNFPDGEITISNTLREGVSFVGLFNMDGTEVHTDNSDSVTFETQLSELPCGKYVICYIYFTETASTSKSKYLFAIINKYAVKVGSEWPPMIMVDGKLFRSYGVTYPESLYNGKIEIIGYTTSYKAGCPTQNGETNLSDRIGLPIAKDGFDAVLVKYGGVWHRFDLLNLRTITINHEQSTKCFRIFDSFSGFKDDYYYNLEFNTPEYPDIEFKVINGSLLYANEKKIIGGAGYGCSALYLTDLTGDSKPELCIVMSCGSGIIDERVVIIDLTTGKEIFHLSDRMRYDYLLFVRDNKLCVRETKLMAEREILRTGTIVSDNGRITVLWDRNADFREDDQENLIEHAIP
ncbi:MAG: hypothetical protein J5850_04740 [Clostridia bacterium]|nr:hypothetical protein [Clostridia bacterium]